MPIYKQSTEITNIDDLLTSVDRDITEVYFGDKNVFTVWDTYLGTLPAQFNANGDDLADYRIYGASGGVGDDSGTAYGYEVDMSVSDGTTSTTTPIYIGDDPLEEDEYVDFGEQKVYRRTENLCRNDFRQGGGYWYQDYGNYDQRCSQESLIPVTPSTEYTMSWTNDSLRCAVQQYNNQDKNQTTNPALSDSGWKIGNSFRFTTTDNTHYIWLQFSSPNYIYNIAPTDSLVTVVKGSTAPSTYIPYLQPTDPPVPLPALPTAAGQTTVSYAGQSAAVPSRFVAKYRKEHT